MGDEERMTQIALIASTLDNLQQSLNAYSTNPTATGSSTLATIAAALAHLQELIAQIGGR